MCDLKFLSDFYGVVRLVVDKLEFLFNGVVMRVVVFGIVYFYDLNEVIINVVRICKVIYCDFRWVVFKDCL